MTTRSTLYQTSTLSSIVIVLAHSYNSPTDRHVAPLGHIDSEPTSLYSFPLMLGAQRRSNRWQFHCLQFDHTSAQSQSDVGLVTIRCRPSHNQMSAQSQSDVGLVTIRRRPSHNQTSAQSQSDVGLVTIRCTFHIRQCYRVFT